MFRPFWPYMDPDYMSSGHCHQQISPVVDESAAGKGVSYPTRGMSARTGPPQRPTPTRGLCGEGPAPVIEMNTGVLHDIMFTIASRPPECGGVFTGPIGDPLRVTGFYFDEGASCSGVTYSPDTETINRKRHEEWLPDGRDWCGFIHSHPNGFDRLSGGDITYIRRLLKLSDESVLIAPVVIPEQFRFVPFVVREGHEDHPEYAHFSLTPGVNTERHR